MTNIEYIHKYFLNVAVLFLSVLLVSCGGGETRSNANPVILKVQSTSPASNTRGVAANAVISATFSDVMDASTINTSTFTLAGTAGSAVAGTVSYSGQTATFKPSSDLTANTSYTATISSSVKNATGQAMGSNYAWIFTTITAADTAPPTVISTSPTSGATGFSVNSSISATFSESLTASTVNTSTFTLAVTAGGAVAGTVSYSGQTATFKPSSDLTANTSYTATITTAVKDLAGNAMASAKTWTFTTGSTTDITPPTVIATSPTTGATNVATNATITAAFSETMAASTLNSSTFTLTGSPGAVAGKVAYSGTTATFTPSSDLSASTTYTATITSGATDAANNPMSANYSWTFTTASAAPASGLANQMGINIAAPLFWEEDRLYADVVRTSVDFSGTTVGTDGWPTSNFSFTVWADMAKMNGTYTLTFNGSATVAASAGTLSTVSYNSATNTSTGTLQFTNSASSALSLTFSNTKRTSTSASGTGVTNIKLMRPMSPGSTTSYPKSTLTTGLFSDPIKALIAKFSVIRFMDYLSTNWSVQSTWAARPLPSWPSFNRTPTGTYGGWQGYGGAWEHVILLSNETGKDAWINIPMHATDDYILKVAQMLAYGSDGVNPYTSAQANPVYPPLNSNLNVYIEYSNELWNGQFQQYTDNCNAALNELSNSSGITPLNWDGSWGGTTSIANNWKFCDRQTTKRTVEISNIFRSVFPASMGTRIRPVLMTQFTNAGATLFNATEMMLNYYDSMASSSNVTLPTPRAPNYYLYGTGGASYYSPSVVVSTLAAFFTDPGMTPTGVITNQWGSYSMTAYYQADMKLAAAMGLKRVAYEGGPDLGYTNNVAQTKTIVESAVLDSRMTTAIVNMHDAWSKNGGDLFVYYRSSGTAEWSFTQDVYNLASKKLLAIDALNSAQRASLNFGTPVPGSLTGSAADACSTNWGCSMNSFAASVSDTSNVWASYTFRATTSANWTVNLSVTSTSSPSIEVYVDGVIVGAAQATTPGTHSLSFSAGTIGSGLHGVIVRARTATAGSFSLNSVAVATN